MNSAIRPASRLSGFSLIAAAIGLTVAALVMVSLLPGKEIGGFNKKASINISRLGVVETAIVGFMAKNSRLPCPADGQYDVSNRWFGIEAASPGVCTGGTPAAPLGPDAGTTFVVGGVIPTKTLGLDDSYAFDEWGHRFTYVVDKRATLNTSCATITTGGITIENTTGGAVVANVMHAFIAHGPDGHGAWPMAGGAAPANRINTGSQDHDKWTNAGVNGSFTYSTANFTNVFIRKEATATFSDIVYYAENLKKNCYVAVGSTCLPSANQSGGTLANGGTRPEFVAPTDPTSCNPNTMTCTNGARTCSTGGMSNCAYSSCAVTGGGTCSPSANQGGGTIAVGGTRINEYTNLSDGTCTSNTLTCNAGTPNTLSCSVGGADLTACTYNSCVQTCSLSANQGGGTLPGSGSNTKTEFASLSDGTCTTHTLTCTGTATTNALSCSVGGADLTACAYSSCGLDCGLTGGQGGGVLLNGAAPLTEYVSANDASCTAYTMSCTNGTLSCSSGGMGNCAQNSCNQTCAPNASQGGSTMNSTTTRNPMYKALTDPTCTPYTMTCTGTLTTHALSCSTGGADLTDCAVYNSCTVTPAPKLSGFRADGAIAAYKAGMTVAAADINGDGIQDLIIGAEGASYNGGTSGSVYVVFGTKSGFPDPLPLSNLDSTGSTAGFRLDGGAVNEQLGNTNTVFAADFNNDGYVDLIVTASNASYNSLGSSGSSYVIYGGPTMKSGTAWSTCPCTLVASGAVINGTNGIRFDGAAANDYMQATAVGDFNGDGINDLIFGAGVGPAFAWSGYAYVVYGGATMKSGTAWSTTNSLATSTLSTKPINGTNGFQLTAATAGDHFGDVAAVGDFNGDGIKDLIISAGNATYNGASSGSVYVIYGGSVAGKMKDGVTAWAKTQAVTLAGTVINGTNGMRIDGEAANDFLSGCNAHQAGIAAADINGDGIADLIIGASSASHNGAASGSAYVVYGGAGGKMEDGVTAWGSNQKLNNGGAIINITNGFRLDGATAGDHFGYSPVVADFNRDGYPDILIGATSAIYNGAASGSAYVVYGGAGGKMEDGTAWAATNILASGSAPINGTDGFRLDGAAGDAVGIVGAGDVNGDGYPDIIVGAAGASPHGAASGAAYMVNGQSCPFAATNSLGTVVSGPAVCSPNTFEGTRMDGAAAGDQAGRSVAVGDVNGDGIPDLIIGASYASYNSKSTSGSVYVVFGTASGFPDPLPLGSLNGANGFRLDGAAAGDYTGNFVAVGDVNGDGKADIIISAYWASYNSKSTSGSVYVVYGGSTMKNGTAWSTCPCLLTSGGSVINATNGFRLDGVTAYETAGYSLAIGDVNGDGKPDIIIGADGAGYNGTSSGSAYVVFGGSTMKNGTAWAATNLLTSGGSVINATNGFRLDGATTNETAGNSVAVGDVNGDGTPDLIIGAINASYGASHSGSVYVVYGGSTMKNGTAWAATNLLTAGGSVINATNGFRLDGATSPDRAGSSVAAGDINGDGKADIIIGAWSASYGASASGSAYVVYGGPTMKDGTAWSTCPCLLTSGGSVINAANGFRLDGATATEYAGYSVAVGDINGDGKTDIIIGALKASYNSKTYSGSAYVVFGGATMKDGTAWAATNLLTAAAKPIDGANGFRLDGATAGDWTGASVATGDVNGDGKSDIIIGTYNAGYNGKATSGSVYVYPGKASGWPNPTASLSTLCPGC